MRKRRAQFIPIMLAIIIVAGTGFTACSEAARTEGEDHAYAMASLIEMPAEVQNAPVSVQQSYQFAVANREILTQIPCYCGCGAMGHRSNYDCYIAGQDIQGDLDFDNHALGCSICVDISQDTMRLLDQGKDVTEIYAYVDSAYARFGPATQLEQ